MAAFPYSLTDSRCSVNALDHAFDHEALLGKLTLEVMSLAHRQEEYQEISLLYQSINNSRPENRGKVKQRKLS